MKHQFEKGKSGNPGGRPKAEGRVRELCQNLTDDVVGVLYDLVMDGQESGKVRVAAANTILAYAVGRPKMAEDDGGMKDYEGVEVILMRRAPVTQE